MAKKKTVLLIDGDVLVYQIGLSVEVETDHGNDHWTLHSDFGQARTALTTRLAELKRELNADELRFALSCPTDRGFRRELAPTYKENRKKVRKPLVYAPLRKLLLEEYDAKMRDRLEADDILGIMATQPTAERRIIVSVDKDFKGVPGEFLRLENNPFREVERITPFAAQRFHAIQALMGDRVDGYAGIPGVGPVKAEALLEGITKPEHLWPAVVAAYKNAGLTKEDALTTARLARILQHGDYDIEKQKIKLWTPSSKVVTTTSTTKPKRNPKSPRTSAASRPSQTKRK